MFTRAIAAALTCAVATANGLKVIISPDHASPTAFVAVYYGVGFRLEPKGRTGFAHLFEHLMFQGSRNRGKMEYIKLVGGNGGSLNGTTRFDFTNYYQNIPSHTLETILWAEADRMKGLQIDRVEDRGSRVKREMAHQAQSGVPFPLTLDP